MSEKVRKDFVGREPVLNQPAQDDIANVSADEDDNIDDNVIQMEDASEFESARESLSTR